MKKRNLPLRDLKRDKHSHDHGSDGGHDHDHSGAPDTWRPYLPALIGCILLLLGLAMDHFEILPQFRGWVRLVWYGIAYVPVGWPVLRQGLRNMLQGRVFTEFFLMGIATIGAFAIGEYPEAVAVMLFYAVGELFQGAAVQRAKGNIKALLDVRPKEALVHRNGDFVSVDPETVTIGERVQVRTGEKIPLDGTLYSGKATVNTAALTGESTPEILAKGETVYAGSINLEGVIEIETTKVFQDSSIARILDMVQHATARKSKTELFIRKFARVYTPIVVFLAIGLTLLPYFFVADYVFQDWLYRALIFLVISCPCALVISIPLGYFGGLGAASRNGILFKGASFLDAITKVDTVVMDKTGTVTRGVFTIQEIHAAHLEEEPFMDYLLALEEQSTHPIAKAISAYAPQGTALKAEKVTEVAGKGLQGQVNGKSILVGNKALLLSKDVSVPPETDAIVETLVLMAIDGRYVGHVIIADALKEDAHRTIKAIRKAGISEIIMLSGDKDAITQQVAKELGIDRARGGLLPEDKLAALEALKTSSEGKVTFMGDGINDAPVLAASDVGIAMGALGSDVAIETADVVIQTDQPSKLVQAIQIGRSTRRIVWQNIGLAFGVKAVVLLLGAGGIATMWEAVFADVGVALLAILNAVRLQRMTW